MAPEARQHGRTRAQLEAGEDPEAEWEPDPVDLSPAAHRRHGAGAGHGAGVTTSEVADDLVDGSGEGGP